jgi:hypothetical protein
MLARLGAQMGQETVLSGLDLCLRDSWPEYVRCPETDQRGIHRLSPVATAILPMP